MKLVLPTFSIQKRLQGYSCVSYQGVIYSNKRSFVAKMKHSWDCRLRSRKANPEESSGRLTRPETLWGRPVPISVSFKKSNLSFRDGPTQTVWGW